MMQKRSAKWKVICLTSSGRGEGYSISRFDDAGYRIGSAFHVTSKQDAETIGRNYVNAEKSSRRKALIRKRWKAEKFATVLLGEKALETDGNLEHVFDLSSPTECRTLQAL